MNRRSKGAAPDAFRAIVVHHQRAVWAIAAYALRDASASEELVQQVFVKVFLSLDRYRAGADFGAWLRTIARNEVRKELRERARGGRTLERYRQWVELRLSRHEEAEARQQELSRALRNCQQELAQPAIEALRLRYEQTQDFDHIGQQLGGRSSQAVRQLLCRARSALRRCIERQLEAEGGVA